MKRFAILFADTRTVVSVHAKADGIPPHPRSDGYAVVEIGDADIRPGMVQQPDGSFSPPPPSLPNVQRYNKRRKLWEVVAPDGTVFKTDVRRFAGLEEVSA